MPDDQVAALQAEVEQLRAALAEARAQRDQAERAALSLAGLDAAPAAAADDQSPQRVRGHAVKALWAEAVRAGGDHSPPRPPPKEDVEALPVNFGQPLLTEMRHCVGDLVWVKLTGFPNWPAELLSPDAAADMRVCLGRTRSKKYGMPARLLLPPCEEGAGEVVWTTAKHVAYFDRLSSAQAEEAAIAFRLCADRYDVSAYERRFRDAVALANAHCRCVLTPECLPGFPVTPVGVVYSHFRAHHHAPRQPSASDAAQKEQGVIVLRDGMENLVRDLGRFSRIWVLFQFSYSSDAVRSDKQAVAGRTARDAALFSGWKAMVVPPRDTVQRGLFATRSPHRPNPIGLSCVRLLSVTGKTLLIRDHDLLHGTPILDIKPYLPFTDSHPEANHGWVDDLETPGPDHRWNQQNYTVHRRMPQSGPEDAPTAHS